MIFMVQVNRVYLIIIFFNRPQFLVDSNDLNYLIRTSSRFAIYPLAGFSYARVTPDGFDGVNRFGANVGVGAEYTINNRFAFYVEERFQILKDMNQSVTCLGFKYKF